MNNSNMTTDLERALYHMKALSELMPRVLPKMQKLIDVQKIFERGHTEPQLELLSVRSMANQTPIVDGVYLIPEDPPTTDRGRIYWLLFMRNNAPLTPKQIADEFNSRGWIKDDDLRFKKRLDNRIHIIKKRPNILEGDGTKGYVLHYTIWEEIKDRVPKGGR